MSFFPITTPPHGALTVLGVSAFTCGLVYFLLLLIDNRKTSPNNLSRRRRPPSPLQSTVVSTVSTAKKQSYVDVFPPSQRAALAELLGPQYTGTTEEEEEVVVDHLAVLLTTTTQKANPKQHRLLKMGTDYRTAAPSDFNFSGFSVAEILSLGDFPNYAALSGVPLPSPLKDFNIDEALPRPYRPFRWAYHQTMSLAKMDTDFWIELEKTYRQRIAQRQTLYAKHGRHVLDSLPGSELACKELMEMVLQFICARYPSQFEMVTDTKPRGKKRAAAAAILVNRILGTQTDFATTPPLLVLLKNVPEDFGIMLRDDETGRYCLRAGMICSSVGWKLSEKLGHGLPAIHQEVPDYKERMEFSMDRFFTKIPTNKPIQRGSWGLEVGQPLYIPAEDPAFAHRQLRNPNLQPHDVHLRVDWQTLRRLPLSGAVVFNFKALFTPLTDFRDEPYVPSLVLKVLNEGKESIMKYKGTWHVEHVVKPVLEAYERFQVENGLVERDWTHQTLSEAPFFPGWERKWRTS